MARRFCDDCRHFPIPVPDAKPTPLPKRQKGESEWRYQARVRKHIETNSFELEREPVCLAGYRMAFQMPKGHPATDHNWGHYRPTCQSFENRMGGAH